MGSIGKSTSDTSQSLGKLTESHGNVIEPSAPCKPCNSLLVVNISQSVSKEELVEEFSRFGELQEFRFLLDHSAAYVVYTLSEVASQAQESMNGKQIGGCKICVDFFRSHSSEREPGLNAREGLLPSSNMEPPNSWSMAQDSMRNYSVPNLTESRREHFLSRGVRKEDSQLTNVLRISYPPSLILGEQMLQSTMRLFGEIERIKIFPDRHCAFVSFRSVEEARHAKERLEGNIFKDPRISFDYWRSEPLSGKYYTSQYPGMKEHIHGLAFQQVQMDFLPHDLPFVVSENPLTGHLASIGIRDPGIYSRPLGPPSTSEPTLPNPGFVDTAHFRKTRDPRLHALIGGPNWRKSSVTPGFVSSPSTTFKPPKRSTSGLRGVHLERESKRSLVPFPAYNTSFHHRRSEDHGGSDDHHGVSKLDIGGSSRRVASSELGQHPAQGNYIWWGVIAKHGSPFCHARCVPVGEWAGPKIPEVINYSARTGLDMLSKHYADAIRSEIVFFLPDSEEDFVPYTEFMRYLATRGWAGVATFDDGTALFLVPPSDFVSKVLKVAGPERIYGVVLKFSEVEAGIMSSQARQPPYADSQQESSGQVTVSSSAMAFVPPPSGSVVGNTQVNLQYHAGSSRDASIGYRVDRGKDALSLYNASAVQVQDTGVSQSRQQPIDPRLNQVQCLGVSKSVVIPEASIEHISQGQQLQSAPYGVVQENTESEAQKNERYQNTLLFALQRGNQDGHSAGSPMKRFFLSGMNQSIWKASSRA